MPYPIVPSHASCLDPWSRQYISHHKLRMLRSSRRWKSSTCWIIDESTLSILGCATTESTSPSVTTCTYSGRQCYIRLIGSPTSRVIAVMGQERTSGLLCVLSSIKYTTEICTNFAPYNSTAISLRTTDTCKYNINTLRRVCFSPSHRRFYPDGQVLSLLANEELAPSQVIPLLKPSLRMKVCSHAPAIRTSRTNRLFAGFYDRYMVYRRHGHTHRRPLGAGGIGQTLFLPDDPGASVPTPWPLEPP